MQACFPQNIPDNASPQLEKLLRTLKILIILQIVLVTQVIACLVVVSDIWQGVMNFLAALILLLIILTKNWCLCIAFVILALSNTLTCIVVVGTYLAETHHVKSWYSIVLFLSLLQVPFYLVALHYAFESYKEMKCKVHAALVMELDSQPPLQVQSYGAVNENQEPPFRPFVGEGQRLG